MSGFEAALTETYRGAKSRLWGAPMSPGRQMPGARIVLPAASHIVDVETLTEREANQKFMGPKSLSSDELAEMIDQSSMEWIKDVRAILTGNGETMRRVRSHHRDAHIIKCRRDLCAYLHQARGWSTTRIGQFIHRDHSSVINLLRPWTRQEKYDRKVAAERLRMEGELNDQE